MSAVQAPSGNLRTTQVQENPWTSENLQALLKAIHEENAALDDPPSAEK